MKRPAAAEARARLNLRHDKTGTRWQPSVLPEDAAACRLALAALEAQCADLSDSAFQNEYASMIAPYLAARRGALRAERGAAAQLPDDGEALAG